MASLNLVYLVGVVVFRKAEEKDDQIIADILVDSFLTTYKKKMPEVVVTPSRIIDLKDVKSRREAAHVFVLEENGEVIGTVSLHEWGTKGSEAWTPGAMCLRMLALTPKAQGRKLSEKIIEECLKISKELGASLLQLHIRRGATGIARLYEGLGFTRCSKGDLDLLPDIYLDAYEKRT